MSYHGKPINEVNGGTNQTTYTTGDIIYSSTTNTLSKLPIGAESTILTVSSGLPSWQTGTTPTPTFSTANLYDDFISRGPLTFSFIAGANTNYPGHPGVAPNPLLNSSGEFGGAYAEGPLFIGEGAISMSWLVNMIIPSDNTNRYVSNIGLGNISTGAEFTDGVYFSYTDNVNSGNWQIKAATGSVRTTTSTAVAATGWQWLTIVINAAGTSATFSIAGVSVGTITTNIPTAASVIYSFNTYWVKGSVVRYSTLLDIFYATETLTTPRG